MIVSTRNCPYTCGLILTTTRRTLSSSRSKHSMADAEQTLPSISIVCLASAGFISLSVPYRAMLLCFWRFFLPTDQTPHLVLITTWHHHTRRHQYICSPVSVYSSMRL